MARPYFMVHDAVGSPPPSPPFRVQGQSQCFMIVGSGISIHCALMQACQKELGTQKAAYERAMAELISRQHAPAQSAQQPEAAAAALRSHPLTETPPREPSAKQSAGPPLNGQAPKMPILRTWCSPGSMR